MSIEKHRCKLCSKIFSDGRALGGHMRSHLATVPLPPNKFQTDKLQLGDRTESGSSSTHSEQENDEAKEEKLFGYGLRENWKTSLKGSDPEFLDAGSVVQDRESETESTQYPTRRRSKRAGQRAHLIHETIESKKSKSESTPVSSVSEASQDEEVALCLMMLSRDDRVWPRREMTEEKSVQGTNDSAELKTRKMWKANKESSKAIIRQLKQEKNNNREEGKIYECPFCSKVFGSGQALGGHKRSHLLGSSTSNNNKVLLPYHSKPSFILDLNLPAPTDDDDVQNHI